MDSTANQAFLAFDLGAESGRAVVGHLENSRLSIEEVHRFPNGPVQVGNSIYWDLLRLWSEIQIGLGHATTQAGENLISIGLDTWGVDFGLLDEQDNLLGNPYHYRDNRTNGMMDEVLKIVPRAIIYETTGIQFMQLNSLYQLFAMVQANSSMLKSAQTFLNIPDLLNFWLTGHRVSEFTIATTTQCYNPHTATWAYPLLEQLGIPGHIFQEIVSPGTILDRILPAIASISGCNRIPVIASAGHDTASAVAAIPTSSPDYIYISSGTWSLLGTEITQPIITAKALAYDFTNEGGVYGTIRLLKNIMGLWLIQECRREWRRRGNTYSYDDLTQMAASVPPSSQNPLIWPGDSRFLSPGDMPTRIQAYCSETRQSIPQAPGAITRCVLESLALEYRRISSQIEDLLNRSLPVIHIIGGGSRNRLLNQLTADATGKIVISGPAEATAIGNILVQAIATQKIESLAEGRAIVRQSFEVSTFEPQHSNIWDELYERYLKLVR